MKRKSNLSTGVPLAETAQQFLDPVLVGGPRRNLRENAPFTLSIRAGCRRDNRLFFNDECRSSRIGVIFGTGGGAGIPLQWSGFFRQVQVARETQHAACAS